MPRFVTPNPLIIETKQHKALKLSETCYSVISRFFVEVFIRKKQKKKKRPLSRFQNEDLEKQNQSIRLLVFLSKKCSSKVS